LVGSTPSVVTGEDPDGDDFDAPLPEDVLAEFEGDA